MNDVAKSPSPHRLAGAEHWTTKDGNVKLFLWNKCEAEPAHTKGIILFVPCSSMAIRRPTAQPASGSTCTILPKACTTAW